MWYADSSGAHERSILLRLDFKVRRGAADIPAGIAAVLARIQTGRLKVVASACPNLLEEARQYRYRPAGPDHGPPAIYPSTITSTPWTPSATSSRVWAPPPTPIFCRLSCPPYLFSYQQLAATAAGSSHGLGLAQWSIRSEFRSIAVNGR